MTTDPMPLIARALNLLLPEETQVGIVWVEQHEQGENVYQIDLSHLTIAEVELPAVTMLIYLPPACCYEDVYEVLEQTIGTLIGQHLGYPAGESGLIVGYAPAGVICYRFMLLPKDGQAWLNEYLPGAQLVGMYLCENMGHAVKAEATLRRLIAYARNTMPDPRIFSDSKFLSIQAEAAVKGTR